MNKETKMDKAFAEWKKTHPTGEKMDFVTELVLKTISEVLDKKKKKP
jgi:hypothetical protein